MDKSDSIKELAGALAKAQGSSDYPREGLLIARLLHLIKPRFHGNALDGKSANDRLREKIAFGSSDCWLFIGCVDALGYGRMSALGENKAHRVSYILNNGNIPVGMKVLHRCDVRNCVNPAHLFLGTQSDNMNDMVSKGRNAYTARYGESNPMSKLTTRSVLEIKCLISSGIKQNIVAKMYKVSPMTISRVKNNQTWREA